MTKFHEPNSFMYVSIVTVTVAICTSGLNYVLDNEENKNNGLIWAGIGITLISSTIMASTIM